MDDWLAMNRKLKPLGYIVRSDGALHKVADFNAEGYSNRMRFVDGHDCPCKDRVIVKSYEEFLEWAVTERMNGTNQQD